MTVCLPQKIVRTELDRLVGGKQGIRNQVVSDETMGLASAQTDYVPCDIATFRVDLSRPGLKSRYNKLVAFVFVKHLLEKVLEPPILDADQQTKDRFLAMFWSHLTYLQTQYRARNITQQEIQELHRKDARYQRKRTVRCLVHSGSEG